ncbi:hypothetical protein BH18ACT9_BH18ACT9_11930 [soil metagenome]
MSMHEPESSRSPLPAVEDPPRHWSELSLDGLRDYRRTLAAEEEKISYWRRLVHARIDVLEAEAQHERELTIDELVRVLGDTGAGHGRTALVSVEAAAPLPDLPVLEEMWVTELDPNDPVAVAEAVNRLRVAEKQLTQYRHGLHQRLDDATGELIVRYREAPAAALVAFSRPHRRTGGMS